MYHAGMARYDKKKKLERNRELANYASRHPELSLEEIGREFGITRQRVWVILSKQKMLSPR